MNRGQAICEELTKNNVRWVCTVPDSEVHFMHVAMEDYPKIKVIQTCAEGETLGIISGLCMAGERGTVLIEDQGLFDSGNVLKWSLGLQLPLVIMVGYLMYPHRHSPWLEPFLKAFDVPYWIVDADDKVSMVSEAFAEAERRRGMTAILLNSADGYKPGTATPVFHAKGAAR